MSLNAMSKPIIEVQRLSKRYRLGVVGATTLRDDVSRMMRWLRNPGQTDLDADKDFWALRDVSFSIQPGEVVGILGRNGAGKSTLLKILSRITEPTSGRARWRGRVASLLEVGTGFHPDLTGRENVYLNGAILGMKKREIAARFDEIVAFAEVEKFIDTPVKHYSSGMRVRLAFAVAAHLDSEVLIADEVLAVGDVSFQRRCLSKMQSLNEAGRSVIFVSHNPIQVSAICSSCVWLSNGTVTMVGPQAEVLPAYLVGGASQDESFVDIRTWPRPDGLARDAVLKSFEWLTPNPLPHGSSLRWRVQGQTNVRCADVAIGLGISSAEGTRLISLESDFEGSLWDMDKGCEFMLEGRLDQLNLAPGLYTISIGIRSGPLGVLDFVQIPGQLHMVSNDSPRAARSPMGSGLHLHSIWQRVYS